MALGRSFRDWTYVLKRNRSAEVEPADQDKEEMIDRKELPSWRASYTVLVTRLAIMVVLALFIAGTAFSTWWWTSSSMRSAVSHLGDSLREDLLNRTRDRMDAALDLQQDAASTISKAALSLYRSSGNVLGAGMYEVLWALASTRLDTLTVGLATPSGTALYLVNNVTATSKSNYFAFWSNASAPIGAWAPSYAQHVDAMTGEHVGPVIVYNTSTDIRSREYYTEAAKSPPGVPNWSLLLTLIDQPTIAASLAIRSPSGDLLGVAVVFQSLQKLSDYASQLELHGGSMYVCTADHQLVASSDPLRPGKVGNLRRVNDSGSPLLVATDKCLTERYGLEHLTVNETKASGVYLLGQNYYLDTLPLKYGTLPMFAAIMLPRSSIMGTIDRNSRKTVIFLFCLSGGFFVAGCILVTLLTSRVSTEIQLKRELESLKCRAEANSTAKSQFLSNMSHELRTPMAGILGLLDILLLDDLSPEQEVNVTQIRQCATGLLGLLNNLLDIGKIEANKLELEASEFDLGAELESLVDMFSVQGAAKGVNLGLDLHDDMERMVCGDQARLRQVFANLLSNAIKFSFPGGKVVVRGWPTRPEEVEQEMLRRQGEKKRSPEGFARGLLVALRRVMERSPPQPLPEESASPLDRMHLTFEVEDWGLGIPPDKRDQVFENFVQADASTTRLHGGTGLGLSIVKCLVHMMDGEIDVVDKPGPGTLLRFTVQLESASTGPSSMHTLTNKLIPRSAVQHVRVLLSMPGVHGRAIAVKWMVDKGLTQVEEATTWREMLTKADQMLTAVENLMSQETGTKAVDSSLRSNGCGASFQDLLTSTKEPLLSESRKAPEGATGVKCRRSQKHVLIVVDIKLVLTDHQDPEALERSVHELLPFRDRGAVIGWLVAADTSSTVRQALNRCGYQVLVSKPFYASRMLDLLTTMLRVEKIRASASSSLQQEEQSQTPQEIGATPALEITPPVTPPPLLELPQLAPAPQGDVHIIVEDSPKAVASRIAIETSATSSSSTTPRSITPYTARSSPEGEEPSLMARTRRAFHGEGENRTPPLAGLRVLVAEDTPVLQRLAAKTLEKMGAVAVVVGDGEQAVKAIFGDGSAPKITPSFDCILMDCQMPKLDGYCATRAIREGEKATGGHVPIIALTAHAMASDREKCLEAGMSGYLTKPINPKQLAATIKDVVKVRAQP